MGYSVVGLFIGPGYSRRTAGASAGDFAQLPPAVGGFPLYSGNVNSLARAHTPGSGKLLEGPMGKSVWHQFTSVVLLRKNMRQATQSEEDAKFRTCLENLRYRACTVFDIALLRARIVGYGKNDPKLTDPNFRNVPIITRLNAFRDGLNAEGCIRFCRESNQPPQSFYSSDVWTAPQQDDDRTNKRKRKNLTDPVRTSSKIPMVIQNILWNLPPSNSEHIAGKLELCIGLPVVIRKNQATECGVTNGAEGIVVGWKTRKIDKDHTGLDTVFVELNNKNLNIHIEGLSANVVPVQHTPLSVACTMPNGDKRTVKRDQVPLLPNFACTDYSSQGRTRLYNVVDLYSFDNHQAIYTALTRGTTYRGTLLVQGFDSRYMTGGISGYLRQEFRELELLDEITRLRYEGVLPKNITGVRNMQIFHYRQWKGAESMPSNMPQALRWSADNPYGLEEPEDELTWKIVKDDISQEDKEKHMMLHRKKHLVGEFVPAQGSKPVQYATNVVIDTTISNDVGGRHPHKRRRQENVTAEINGCMPQGIKWNSINYSCAYDSLFTVLFEAYKSLPPPMIDNCKRQNDVLHKLFNLYKANVANTLTLEETRDEVRAALYNLNNRAYPLLGHVGASVSELCVDLFRDTDPYATWTTQCTSCNTVTRCHPTCSMLWFLSKQLWKASSVMTGNIRNGTLEQWLEKVSHSKSDLLCRQCTRNMVKTLQWVRMPTFLAICVQDVRPQLQHIINVNNVKYRLCGIIYHGSAHFTCRVIDSLGNIWYHDGITTMNKCEFEGNLSVYSVRNLWKVRQHRTVNVILYVRVC